MRFEDVYRFQNLYQAHVKSRRGKRGRREDINFELDLGQQLCQLQWELRTGIYTPKPYKQFQIYDPKKRMIHALQYRDRIVQHSLCDNIIEPYTERHLIYDNAASRKGKGTHFAMNRLDGFLHSFYKAYGTSGYFLKYDIHKFFDSIDHEILYRLYEKAFCQDTEICTLIRPGCAETAMSRRRGKDARWASRQAQGSPCIIWTGWTGLSKKSFISDTIQDTWMTGYCFIRRETICGSA